MSEPPNSPEAMIQEVDRSVPDQFARLGMVVPLVTLFADEDEPHIMNLLGLFQASGPQDAARKKAMLIPLVRDYIAERKLDVKGYVFVCQGFSAGNDKKTRRELASGKSINTLTNRVPVVFYCCEMSDLGGIITRAFGEREISLSPRKLLDLQITNLDHNIGRIGFGILDGIPKER